MIQDLDRIEYRKDMFVKGMKRETGVLPASGCIGAGWRIDHLRDLV